MSVVLGIVPVIAAWLYSEYLHFTKHSVSAKAYVLLLIQSFFFFFIDFVLICVCCSVCVSRHSDVNLVEIGKEFVKEDDDKALLIEDGGGLQSSAPKAKPSSSAHSPLIRFH